MNTATNRFRGRAGRRIVAAVVAAAALGLGSTACGPDSDAAGSSTSSASSDSSAASDSASTQSTNGSSSDKSATAPSAGGGVANAGNRHSLVGTLAYLAPGKLTVKPEGGATEQAFLVSNATKILGAAAICSGDSGSVSIGDDGFGTSECSVDELEKAAKTNSVSVRVTMDTKSGGAETVEEKYHP